MIPHRRSYRAWCAALAALVLTGATRADHIWLRDGREFDGTISRQGGQMLIHVENGNTVTVTADQVQRVALTGTQSPAEKSESEWTRIKSTIARTDDLRTITGMLATFIKTYPDLKLTAAAQQMLDQYNQYATDGFIKFRNKWMAPDTRDAILHQAATQAKLALTLYRSGKLKEALDTALDALKTDEQNSTALATAGLATARLSKWVKAKDYFQKLAEVDPGDVLAQNNLAIVAYIQHRQPEGLLDYKKALDAAPANRLLLDNITEALGDYHGAKDVPAYTDLVRAFVQADARMADQMAQRGLYRFGSTWVTQEQKDRLLSGVLRLQQKMADLDAAYRQALAALQTLDQQGRQTAANYDAEMSDVSTMDVLILQEQSQGFVDVLLIGRRDAILADISRLYRRMQEIDAQKTTTQTALKQMRIEADRLKTQLAAIQISPLTGVQRIMEIGDVESPPPPAAVRMGPRAEPGVIAAPVNPALAPVAPPLEWPGVNPDKIPGGGQ